ncbi:uncharacterized protein LOC141586257 [Silene latifolia]|uniref:uncharacterized protein LOC141586257 n=1 Tax=Silene latifolia TaxID=37657 RepID=UPI003D776CC5
MALPKHTFVAWMVSNEALMLKSRLYRLNISQDDLCCICSLHEESHQHLFQGCIFSQTVIQEVENWLGSSIGQQHDCLQHIAKRRWSKIRKRIVNAAIQACWYLIWQYMNEARLLSQVPRPGLVAREVQCIVSLRVRNYVPLTISNKDREWLQKMHFV